MRINGMNVSRGYLPKTAGQEKNLPFIPSLSFREDNLSLSNMALRLSKLRTRGDNVTQQEKIINPTNNKTIALMDESISRINETLMQMKELSALAENSTLTKEDSVTLQEEMTRLQAQLFKDTHYMGMKQSGMSEMKIQSYFAEIEHNERATLLILQRERERLKNGGDLPMITENNDETFSAHIIAFGGVGHPGETLTIYRMNQPSDKTSQGEASNTADAANAANYNFLIGQEETVKGYRTPENPLLATGSLTVTDYGYFITGTKETVEKYVNINAKVGYEDLLKNTNLLVTDAKSAKRSIEHIDREIENLAKIRDKLSDFSQSLSVQKNGKDSENTLNDSDGLKNKLPKYGAPDHYGQRGGSKFIADIRLQQIESPMDAMLNSVDSLFKDSIYKNLGLGLCWSMVAGETAALA